MDDDALLNALKRSKGAPNGTAKGNNRTDSPVGRSNIPRSNNDPVRPAVVDTSLFEHKLPEIKPFDSTVAKKISISTQQKNNISAIAYALNVLKGEAIEPARIYEMWPTAKFKPELLNQAGPRPSITAIQQFMETEQYVDLMAERGVTVNASVGLTFEQIALITILSNTTSRETIRGRLKRAGVTYPTYTAWRRQRPFAEALAAATGAAMTDAIENTDVQLAVMAQNGDLNAIKYFNELMGRAPDDKKAVDAMAFAKLILEVVQRNVDKEQALAISSEIGLLAKQLGIGR